MLALQGELPPGRPTSSPHGRAAGETVRCETPALKQSCGLQWCREGPGGNGAGHVGPGLILSPAFSRGGGASGSLWLSLTPHNLGQSKATRAQLMVSKGG